MAEEQDKASKTEEPTWKRLEEARKEGNFAKAEEIQVVFGMLAAFGVVLFYSPQVSYQMVQTMREILFNVGRIEVNRELVLATVQNGAGSLLWLILPVCVAAVAASILAGGVQSGFRLSPKALGFKGKRLNPINGFKQKYGKSAYVKSGFDFLKLLSIAGVITFGVYRVTRHPIFYTEVEAREIAIFIFETTLLLFGLLVLALGFIGILNFLYKKQKLMTDLRMTKREVKDEMKQQEGDPQVKSARKQLARRLMERQMFQAIPGADVVVTNPTHYAVALRYDRNRDAAPVLLAKGQNLIAQRIKEIAREHRIPMVENKPVAQSLFKLGQPGKPIPRETYQVVAKVLAYVYRTHRSFYTQRRRRLQAESP